MSGRRPSLPAIRLPSLEGGFREVAGPASQGRRTTASPHLWRGYAVIARSTNRICVIDPERPDRCLKFELPPGEQQDTSWRNRLRRWLGRSFPYLSYTTSEWRAYCRYRRRLGDRLHEHVAECFGMLWTDHGSALWCARVTDAHGHPAQTLEQRVKVPRDPVERLIAAVDRLETFLLRHSIPLFDLSLHNLLVIEESEDRLRLVSVDLKSVVLSKELLPISRWSRFLMHRKIRRRAERLRRRIRRALAKHHSRQCSEIHAAGRT